MKILVRSWSLALIGVMIFSYYEPIAETRSFIYPEGKNFLFIERIICRTYSKKLVNARCIIKYIDRNHMKADAWVNITAPITDLWIHVVIYYKYNTYMKIGTEYWDDVCKWLSGKSLMSYALNHYKPMLTKHSDINHECPYSGPTSLLKFTNMSAQYLAFPQIVPSGRYRVEVEFYENNRKTLLAACSVYSSVSDHRLEVV